MKYKIPYLFIFIMLAIVITIVIVTVVTVTKVSPEDEIVRTIPQGILQGYERLNNNGETFYAYRSIPYAEPPIGTLRFMPPVPHKGWANTNVILNATNDVPTCYQTKHIGQEDCLYLNIYTKKKFSVGSRKAVIVFFHGGAFVEGSAREETYNPDFLMTEDIVFVTANYRVGLLGFLTLGHGDTQITANVGLKDQTLVLTWIKNNIRYFGGDSSSVTIMGESAGGCAVHLHMFSPLSAGLFHRVIAQSGTALVPWSIGTSGAGERLSQVLNIPNETPEEILEILQKKKVSDFVDVEADVIHKLGVNVPRYGSPVVEGDINGAFLPVHPSVLLSSGNYNNVPIIMGYNDKEGLLVHLMNAVDGEYMDLYDLVNLVSYDLNLEPEEVPVVVKLMEDFYFQGRQPVIGDDAEILVDVITDTWFLYGVVSAAEKHSQFSNSVFLYRFSADTELNYFKRLHPLTARYKGACHVDELGYLFKNMYTPKIKKHSVEEVKITEMVKLWVNFAKYSNPTPRMSDSMFGELTWSPVSYSSPNRNFLYIGNRNLHVDVNPDNKRVQFWQSIYSKYGK